MALTQIELTQLAKATANAKAGQQVAYTFNKKDYSYSDLNETLRAELVELSGSYKKYRKNKTMLFELIEDVIDEVLPQKVMDQYQMFAETKFFGQGDKPVFIQKVTTASKRRAKQFITKVGLAGIYEVFKLDSKNYEVPTSAYGGAAQISFEEFLDGRVDFADVLDVVMEGLDEAIYIEIERALKGAVSTLPAANVSTQTSFDETEFDKLLVISNSYGQSAIYCTYEFATTMIPASGWVSDEMRNQRWQHGYNAVYKGHNVIVLKQSFEDETNTVKVIDPSYCWIMPTGTDKPIKIAFEGATIVKESENSDNSREIQVYKKVGIAAIMTNNICVYRNTSIA